MKTVINYPGGSGGNWLFAMLTSETSSNEARFDWREHGQQKFGNPFCGIHSLDNNYDLLYSGSYNFNFYLNVLFKNQNLFESKSYRDRFFEFFNTARWLHDWSTSHGHKKADVCFDKLLTDPLSFYQQVVSIQQNHDLPCTEIDDFYLRRKLFFESCVKSDSLFENFDDMTFVIFILALLQRKGLFPGKNSNFEWSDPSNTHLLRKFAQDHYESCPGIKNFVFVSGKQWPGFL